MQTNERARIGESLTLPGETPIQANRRLCAEGGRDTLPEQMGKAIKNFRESWARAMAQQPPRRTPEEIADERHLNGGEREHDREHREENEAAERELALMDDPEDFDTAGA